MLISMARKDIVEKFNKYIEYKDEELYKSIDDESRRVGRIQYRGVEYSNALFIYFDENKIYDTFEDYKNILEKLKKGELEVNLDPFMDISYWIKNMDTLATAVKVRSKYHSFDILLESLFDATDYLGEPIYEDLKLIKWKIPNTNRYFIILLPNKKPEFDLIIGKSNFLDTSELWKNGA